jgi:hypothetical protein
MFLLSLLYLYTPWWVWFLLIWICLTGWLLECGQSSDKDD